MSTNEALSGTDTPSDTAAERSRTWWVAGLALLVLVIVVLVGAVLVAQRLRPHVGIEPVPAARSTSVATSVPQPTAGAAAAGATSIPTSAATTTQPGLALANSPLEKEIEEAYLRYWDVLKQAYLNLDTS